MEGLMKGYSGVLAMWRGWRGIGFLREYVGVCAGTCSVGRQRKGWNSTVKDCLRERGLDIRQAKRMVQSECWGFVRQSA